ncbi:killer toxin alpha/beta [Apodospora peruviana]|uniref:chitinase n=1 Tax=Apodospora peruviana TaxID=516989 RepID=A0AAE0I3T2_9PEZI|nr:killer toxin alpha/beta [Apodospora peruviana]
MRPLTTRGALLAFCLTLRTTAQSVEDDLDDLIPEGVDNPNSYYADLHPCPVACDDLPPSNWTIYTSYERLARCDEPLLFDFALYNPVADPLTPTKLRVCTAGNADSTVNSLFNGTAAAAGQVAKRALNETSPPSGTCDAPGPTPSKAAATLEFAHGGADMELGKKTNAISKALKKLQGYFEAGNVPCEETIKFAYHQGIVAGLYLGKSFGKATVSSAVSALLDKVQPGSSIISASTLTVQLCGDKRSGNHVLGLVVDVAGNITTVQNTVKDWHEAKCLGDFESKVDIKDMPIWEDTTSLLPLLNDTAPGNGTNTNFTRRANNRHALETRQSGSCRTIQVEAGNGCWALSDRCGISLADFEKYNAKDLCKDPDPNKICSGVQIGQRVCCSAGGLPDIKPKKGADGVCATYRVEHGNNCCTIATNNGLTYEEIDKFNNGTTWGWYGCGKLLQDVNICLSEGKPPMPYPFPNAVCGPTVPGTRRPEGEGNTKIPDLNPCPLNACCNVWGQCGISGDFCTEKKSETGNPGTSALRDGCVTKCGMDIRNKDEAPGSFGRVGYYETWNFNRDCLNMHVENSNTDGSYTIIHWAFAEVNTADWSVKIRDDFNQWDKFKKISAKKVISFGGWGFSTEPETYDILRQAMSPQNRAKFSASIASFLTKENLDGVDFDWEYPGAIDIPGTPPGQPTDGANYLKFLSVMKSALPAGKTMSIAAPASYWYLKSFPIRQMAEYLDYIVYMTYDLHGQWDAGNEYSIEGCPAGNCLRSHVNLTETNTALSMITKAGVKTNKIMVGESSYGRSFKMAQADCPGPKCTFLGDRLNSPAKKGRCTDTAGYISNAEIYEIISSKETDFDNPDVDIGIPVKSFHDFDSNSDILIYDNTEWVAYMTETTKSTRRDTWKGLNFAGTIDWAVDLQSFTLDDFHDPKGGDFPEDTQELPEALSDCKGSYDSLEKIGEAADIPSHCVPVYMVEVMANILTNSMKEYDDLMADGYDRKFNTYADAVVKSGKRAVRDWMYAHGNDYFTCDVVEPISCCKWCQSIHRPEHGECRYCDNKYCNGWDTVCENPEVNCPEQKTGWFNVTGPCPPDYSKRAGPLPVTGYGQSIYWHLRNDKEAAFWADLYKGVGIEQKDLTFQNVENYHSCTPATPDQCKYFGWDYGIAVPHGYDKEDVIDPKDVVEDAYKNLKDVVHDLPRAVTQLKEGNYRGSAFDLADAMALPVFMIEEAVTNIKTISDKIDEMEEEKRKNLILAFLSAIFFFVPVLGQIASAVSSLATIGRVLAVLGTAGELATDIYNVVNTKGNDPLDIFGLVLAPLAIFDGVQIAKAASRARGMNTEDIGKLGKNVQGKMDLAKKTSTMCKLGKRNVFPMGALPVSGLINSEPVLSSDY